MGAAPKAFGALAAFLPFFLGFVAAKPPLARPVVAAGSAAVSHLVIIVLMRRWRAGPRRAAPLAEWSLVFEESVLCGCRVDRCATKDSPSKG